MSGQRSSWKLPQGAAGIAIPALICLLELTVFAEPPLLQSFEDWDMLNCWIWDCCDTYDAKKCLLFSQVYSLASLLSLPAYFERRLPGSDREGKVHLSLALFELNNVPRTPEPSWREKFCFSSSPEPLTRKFDFPFRPIPRGIKCGHSLETPFSQQIGDGFW